MATLVGLERLKIKLAEEIETLSWFESDNMTCKGIIKEQKDYIKMLKEIINDWQKILNIDNEQ